MDAWCEGRREPRVPALSTNQARVPAACFAWRRKRDWTRKKTGDFPMANANGRKPDSWRAVIGSQKETQQYDDDRAGIIGAGSEG